MIRYIHVPIEALVLKLSRLSVELLSMLLVSISSMDLALSVRAALDLKEILARLMQLESIKRMHNRMDRVTALIDGDMEHLKQQIREHVRGLENRDHRRIRSILERNPSARSDRYKEIFEEFQKSLREKR